MIKNLINEGNIFFIDQDFPEVERVAKRILSIEPTNTEAIGFLQLVNDERKDFKKAADFLFLKTKLQKCKDSQTWLELVERYFEIGDFESADYCAR